MKESYTLKQELTFAEFLSSTIYISIRMKIIKRFFFFGVGISILNGILNTLLAAKPPQNWYEPAIQFILVPVFMICFFGVVTTIITSIIFIRMPRHFKGITFYFNHWSIEKRSDSIDFGTPWETGFKFERK